MVAIWPRQRTFEKEQPGARPFHIDRARSRVRRFEIVSVLIAYRGAVPGEGRMADRSDAINLQQKGAFPKVIRKSKF